MSNINHQNDNNMQHSTTTITTVHKGAVVNAIENRYTDGRVTQRIYANGLTQPPTDLVVLFIGRGRVGKIADELFKEEYHQYRYHYGN